MKNNDPQSFNSPPHSPAYSKENLDLALKRLSYREHSTAELRAYLLKKKIESAECDTLIQYLCEISLLDDLRFARIYSRVCRMKGQGLYGISSKLKRKGIHIAESDLKEMIDEVQVESELETAMRIIQRKYPRGAQDIKIKNRAFQALLRRGYSMDIAKKAISNTYSEKLAD